MKTNVKSFQKCCITYFWRHVFDSHNALIFSKTLTKIYVADKKCGRNLDSFNATIGNWKFSTAHSHLMLQLLSLKFSIENIFSNYVACYFYLVIRLISKIENFCCFSPHFTWLYIVESSIF